jgi:hypothetical protein
MSAARNFSWVWLALVVAVTASCADDKRAAGPPDSWSALPPAGFNEKTCRRIPDALVLPVSGPARAGAIRTLELEPFLPLNDGETAALLGAENVSASKLMSSAIARMEAAKHRVLAYREGSWGGVNQQALDELQAFQATRPVLSPFLVRGLAVHEKTGGFYASLCGGTLSMTHLSLGGIAPPARIPVVVFLDRAPANLVVSLGVAH